MPNPNPPTEHLQDTQFQPGQSGNPGGKTAEHRRLEVDSAERAARIRNRKLIAMERQIEEAEANEDVDAVAMLTGDMLRMLADAEDRGFGKPKQSVDIENPDGSLRPPSVVELVAVTPEVDDDDGEASATG